MELEFRVVFELCCMKLFLYMMFVFNLLSVDVKFVLCWQGVIVVDKVVIIVFVDELERFVISVDNVFLDFMSIDKFLVCFL